jgi:hypothetical protein
VRQMQYNTVAQEAGCGHLTPVHNARIVLNASLQDNVVQRSTQVINAARTAYYALFWRMLFVCPVAWPKIPPPRGANGRHDPDVDAGQLAVTSPRRKHESDSTSAVGCCRRASDRIPRNSASFMLPVRQTTKGFASVGCRHVHTHNYRHRTAGIMRYQCARLCCAQCASPTSLPVCAMKVPFADHPVIV